MKEGSSKVLNKLSILGDVPYWIFLVLFVISGTVSVIALRSNNQTMSELRQAVYMADEKGQDVEKPLAHLRSYVHAHMNTNLASGGNAIKPPIQLKHTYERLQSAENKRINDANKDVYTRAQEQCERENTAFFGRNRLACIENYVTSNREKAVAIPTSLYQFDFVSPTWSPDLAGWSLVVTALFLLLFAVGLISDRLIKTRFNPD